MRMIRWMRLGAIPVAVIGAVACGSAENALPGEDSTSGASAQNPRSRESVVEASQVAAPSPVSGAPQRGVGREVPRAQAEPASNAQASGLALSPAAADPAARLPAPANGELLQPYGTDGDWSLAGNAPASTAFLGTTNSTDLLIKSTGYEVVKYDGNPTSPNIRGGSSYNVVSSPVGGTIGGGGQLDYPNKVLDDYGFIGGGANNTVGTTTGTNLDGAYAAVAGGWGNKAKCTHCFVGGGRMNEVGGGFFIVGGYSAIGGGYFNNAANGYAVTIGGGSNNTIGQSQATYYATIAGGSNNNATGNFSSIGGGYYNATQGQFSYAVGRYANADDDRSFIFSGRETDTAVYSQAAGSFNVYAPGGTWFYSNEDATAGVRLVAGGGAFTDLSDRNAKLDIAEVNAREVLKKVTSMPVSTWSYKSESGVRHMGPMAQDFYAAFGLGADDKGITTVDGSGVALAAIKGLDEVVQEQKASIQQLSRENAELKTRMEKLEQVLSARPALASSKGMNGAVLGLGAIALGGVFMASRRRRNS